MNQKINPWESLEIKNYNKLISEFGIEKISSIIKKLPVKNHYFSRNIVFGHKSLQVVLEASKKKKPFVMMTGLMPSGKFHFGHKMVADLIIYFQKIGAECYIAVADIESYLTRGISFEEAKKTAINEYLKNYIALGLKPKKVKFYFQSNGSANYNNLSKIVSKRTTLNELKSIYGPITPDKMMSVFTQVADILYPQLKENGGPKPVVVPVGADQLPHINLTRDIANRMKSEYKFVLPSATFSKMIPGLKGGKMSSSDPNSAIFLTDSPKEVEQKIKRSFSGGGKTLAEHKKKGGNPDIDVSFQYLRMFFEPDDKKLAKIYNDYKSGKMLTSELKGILIDKINKFLKKHQAALKKVDVKKFF